VLILICSLAASPCDRSHARVELLVPEDVASPGACMFTGQAYIAETDVTLAADEFIKVVCQPYTSGGKVVG
jgi:hypothetical protein